MTIWDWLKAGLLLCIIFFACEFTGQGISQFLMRFEIGSYLVWGVGVSLWLLVIKFIPNINPEIHERKDEYRVIYRLLFAFLFGWVGTAVLLNNTTITNPLLNAISTPIILLFITAIKMVKRRRRNK